MGESCIRGQVLGGLGGNICDPALFLSISYLPLEGWGKRWYPVIL